jgi:hypothetical protein
LDRDNMRIGMLRPALGRGKAGQLRMRRECRCRFQCGLEKDFYHD